MISRVIAARIRASMLRLRGARIGAKSGVGPRVVIRNGRGLEIGSRVEIEHDVYLKLVADDARLAIGDYSFVGRGSEIDVEQSVVIGSHVLIAPNVFITDHTHRNARALRIDEQGTSAAPVTIGSDAWIGAGAILLPGVRIGEGAVVGAGAVVTKSVAAFTIVAGVPARVIGERQ